MRHPTTDPADVRRFVGELRADAARWRIRAALRWQTGMAVAVTFAVVSVALYSAGYTWAGCAGLLVSVAGSHFSGRGWYRALKEADWSDETARIWADTLAAEDNQ